MVIDSFETLYVYLAEAQVRRAEQFSCTLSRTMASRLSDDAIEKLLTTHLPLVQRRNWRWNRVREGMHLSIRLSYRDGVRIMDALQAGKALAPKEQAALESARCIVHLCQAETPEATLEKLYAWVCGNICYYRLPHGGHPEGACGVLSLGMTDCQGFADVMYLLCSLAGIPCEYRCGAGVKQLHMWNVAYLPSGERLVDASKGARGIPY